jgi:hypothetical protein
MLKTVGFYKDLPHGFKSHPELKSVISGMAHPHTDAILNYLRSGEVHTACPGLIEDVLSEERILIGSPHIMTDGVWAWPNDLAYYVEKYHVKLPEVFIDHMKSNKWQVPENIDVLSLEIELPDE